MGLEDTSSRRLASVRDMPEIRPGYVVLASCPLPDVRQLRPRPYVALFCKQKYVISLPFVSLGLFGSFDDACRYHEREPDSYYPIAPDENGGIYDPIRMASGSFSGYIDLLCPTTLGKHSIEWHQNMGRISDEDLTKVTDAHKGLVWGVEEPPHKETVTPPLVDVSSGNPLLSQSDPGSTRNTCRIPRIRRRRSTPIVRSYNRDCAHDQGDGEGCGANRDPWDPTAQVHRKTSPQNSRRKHKRKRQDHSESPLKRARHLSLDSRDIIRGSGKRTKRGRLSDSRVKLAAGDWSSCGPLEAAPTLSPESAQSWTWSGTSSETEEAWGGMEEESRGQEEMAIPNIPSSPRALTMTLPPDGQGSLPQSHHTSPLLSPLHAGRSLNASTSTEIDTASAGASNFLPNPDGDKRRQVSHHRYLQTCPRLC
ncbi:unnamed protein product [Tuber aestivum]|uniref:Uncharacterized protein n=1 Tax=Tuber aestivum TaxID=59557 RepID=A0A292PUF2_9PEZI|nr:unnamed protein product [Tuber aestivum]